MITAFHGSPALFDRFELNNAGDGSGIKFGYGVYLTDVVKTAVHYSQPRHTDIVKDHYLYTVEIPDLTPDNHLVSALPVPETIVRRVEAKLGQSAPAKVLAHGKEFRNWIGSTLMGTKKSGIAEEKAAAEFLDSIGVMANVWPNAQSKPDGPKNYTIFNPANVRIVKRERIEIEDVKGKYVLIPGTRQEV